MKIDREKVHEKYGGRCGYCGRLITLKEMQVDHMHPLFSERFFDRQGINVHSFENLMPTCRKCNHYKRANTVEGFRLLMRDLHKRLKKIYIVEVAVNFGMTDIQPFEGKFYFEKEQTYIENLNL